MLLVDTGILYAMADRDDAWHARVRDFVAAGQDSLLVPVTVVPEACYLLNAHLGPQAENALISSLSRRELGLEAFVATDLRRSLELMEDYSDANIGFVDASIVAIAERLGIRRLLTTDRRHFSMIRPRHCESFELLP